MNAQTALNKLKDHLLGKNWYIVDPVGGEQGNEIIVNEIMSKYPAKDKDPVEEYRWKHRKCIWCKHCNEFMGGYGTCKAKAKSVNPNRSHNFCKMFQIKEENKNVY